jgi:hypothetical protein
MAQMNDPAINTLANFYEMYKLPMPAEDSKPSAKPAEDSPPFSPTTPSQIDLFCEEEIDDMIANVEGLKFQTAYGVMGEMGVKVNKQGQFTLMVPQGPLINLTLMKSVHARFYSNYICLSTTSSKADAILSQNLGKMVYKTFHPEVAMQDIYVTYKDNNAMNCALDNLIAKPTKPVKATERTTVAMSDFADLRNETWVPMLLWDGTVIQGHFVSNMGRFCAHAMFGQGRKLLAITKNKRVRAKGKLLCVDMLIARAFLITEPIYGQDQYCIVKKLPCDEDNRAENFVVYVGSYKLQLWNKGQGLPSFVYEVPTPVWSFRNSEKFLG